MSVSGTLIFLEFVYITYYYFLKIILKVSINAPFYLMHYSKIYTQQNVHVFDTVLVNQ